MIQALCSNIFLSREGAMQWYIKRLVIARAMRFTVGTLIVKKFDYLLPGREKRRHLAYKDAK